jgi:hypothetical protein
MLLSSKTMILCSLCNRSLAFLFERMLCLYDFEFFRRVHLPLKNLMLNYRKQSSCPRFVASRQVWKQ